MKNEPAQEDLYGQLLNLMRQNSKLGIDRLPPEEELALQLGVSRVKLRDALAVLEVHGFIGRRKGVGTVINKYILQEKARLDIDNVYEEIILDSGYLPLTLIREIRRLDTTPLSIATRLEKKASEPIMVVKKLLYADRSPVIFLVDYIPVPYFNRDDINMNKLSKSTFSFVQECCEESLENMVAHVDAWGVEGHVAEELNLPEGTPILRVDAIVYSIKQTPIFHTLEYLNTDCISFSFHKRFCRTKFI